MGVYGRQESLWHRDVASAQHRARFQLLFSMLESQLGALPRARWGANHSMHWAAAWNSPTAFPKWEQEQCPLMPREDFNLVLPGKSSNQQDIPARSCFIPPWLLIPSNPVTWACSPGEGICSPQPCCPCLLPAAAKDFYSLHHCPVHLCQHHGVVVGRAFP